MADKEVRGVTLSGMMGGAAEELFADAFLRVLENIEDPNTDHKTTRKVTLVISVKPNEKRTDAVVGVDCKVKLAAVKPIGTVVLLGRTDGLPAAVEVLRQESLFGEPHGRPSGVVAGTGTEGNA